MIWYNNSVLKNKGKNNMKKVDELVKENEFLTKKVEILESAVKQIAVIQYEIDKKLGDLEGLE